MDKTIKVGIITGLIASMIFVYFLDPILRVFGSSVLYLSSWAYSGLIDSIYLRAALGSPRDPALSIFAMMSGTFLGVFMAAATVLVRRRRSIGEERKERSKSSPKKISAVVLVWPVILAVVFLYQTWSLFFQYQIITSFNHHMKIVAPYVSEDEEEIIISEYSLIESESDYYAVNKKLGAIANKNNIRLPENPSYDFWGF